MNYLIGFKKIHLVIKSLLCFFILICISNTSIAQDTGIVRVVVLSQDDGNAIIGANAVLYSPDIESPEIISAGATDLDGLHQFQRVPAGEYRLVISYVGHQTYTRYINIEPDDRLVLQLSLAIDTEMFDEIIVEGERITTTGRAGLRNITGENLTRIPTPGAGGDLISFIQSSPGVVSSGDRGGDLFIRGGTPDQNYVQVDNLQIIKPFHISNLYSAFPAETIQSVDMYAGGFGSKYMGAVSAVVDVRLRPGSKRAHSGSASISPYLGSLSLEGPLNENQSFILMGRKSTIEQFSQMYLSDEINLDFYDITGRYSIQGDNMNCNVTGIGTQDRGRINPDREVDLTWSNFVLGARCLGYNEMFSHPIEFTVGYTSYNNSESDAVQTFRSSGIRQFYMKLDLKDELFSIPFEYGLGVNFRSYQTELSERFSEFESFERDVPIVSVYGSLEWDVSDKLTIQPGLGSQFTLDTDPTLEPRVRMSFMPDGTPNREFSAALGRYTQVLNGITDERDAGTVFSVLLPTSRRGATVTRPLTTSIHSILGYSEQLGNAVRLNIEGYYMWHRYIPVSKWNPDARIEIETAEANADAYGFDVNMEYSSRTFYLSAGYSWAKVEYSAASGDLGAWIEGDLFSYSPPHDQRHSVNLLGSGSFWGFTTSARWEIGTGRPYTRIYGFDLSLLVPRENPITDPGTARTIFTEPYGDRLPVYHRLDVSVERSFQVSERISVDTQIGAINMYDRNNIFYFDVNALQRIDQNPLLPYLSIQTNFN